MNHVVRYFRSSVARWRKSYVLLLFLLLLLLVNFFKILQHAPMSSFGSLIFPFLSGSVPVALIASFIPALLPWRWVRLAFSSVIIAIFVLLFIWEYHLLTSCGTLLSNSVLFQYHTANEAEQVSDLLISGISSESWFGGALWVAVVGGLSISFAWSRRYPILSVVRFLVYVGVFAYTVYELQKEVYEHYTEQRGIPSIDKLSMLERFAKSTDKALASVQRIEDLHVKLMSHDIELSDSIPCRPPHNVVCIMGESLRRQDMHCYGYPLENTPNIDSLVRRNELVLYSDVVAPYPNTDYSLRSIFTYMIGSNNEVQWTDYPSLMSAFRKANYYSYWLSNQEKGGAYISNIYALSSTADSVYYCTENNVRENGWLFGSRSEGAYDEALLPVLRSHEMREQSILAIVHLIGNHNAFANRYPEEWARFQAEDIPEEHLTHSQKKVTAEYMNSILYNDWVVGQMIKYYSESSSLVFYFADHGLSRYDDPDNRDRFNHNWHVTALRIPFMVYMSPRFVLENPDIARSIRASQGKPFKTDLFTHSLSALMGIRTQYADPKQELWSDEYAPELPRRVWINSSNVIEIP